MIDAALLALSKRFLQKNHLMEVLFRAGVIPLKYPNLFNMLPHYFEIAARAVTRMSPFAELGPQVLKA
jgi:hypothetical protein